MASVTDEDGQVDNKHETSEDNPSYLKEKAETDATNNVHVPANNSTAIGESLSTSHEAESASSHHENDETDERLNTSHEDENASENDGTDESLNTSHEAENASSHHENDGTDENLNTSHEADNASSRHDSDAAVDSDNTSFESQNHSLPAEAKSLLSDALKSPSASITESLPSGISVDVGAETSVAQPTTVSNNHNEHDNTSYVDDGQLSVSEPLSNIARVAPLSFSAPQPELETKETVPRPPVEVPVKQASAVVQNNEVSSTSLGDTPNRGRAAAKETKAKVESSVIQGKPEVKKFEQAKLTSSKPAEKTGTSKAKKQSNPRLLLIGAAAVVAVVAIVVFRYSRA